MSSEKGKGFLDRLTMAFFGGLSGGFYGFLLSLLASLCFSQWHPEITLFFAGVFFVIGFFFDNFVYETILIIMNFLHGFMTGVPFINWRESFGGVPPYEEFPEAEPNQPSYLRIIFLIGFGTALSLLSWKVTR